MNMRKEILYSHSEIMKRVKEIGEEISRDYAGLEPIFIGILKGVIFFFADLIRSLSIPARLDFIRASSYGNSMISSGKVKLTKDIELNIKGEHVILVEDIVDTGLTLRYIFDVLKSRDPESIRICALLDKYERRSEQISIDYCGFKIESGFVVGYGIDYAERYRHLPHIYVLKNNE